MENRTLVEEEESLDTILDRCRAGDSLAWEWLVRRYQSRVFAIAFHFTGNREDAFDLAQEIFFKIYRNLSSCSGEQHFLPWLIRIARNTSIDFLRRRQARPDSDSTSSEIPEVIAREETPEQQVLRRSRVSLFYKALQSLTEINREILLLKEIQGLRLHEIADILEVPLGTLKSRCHRARLELAQQVAHLMEQEGRTS